MRTLAERVAGKSIRSIEVREPELGIGIVFDDGAALTVHTSVLASLRSEMNGSRIERMSSGETHVTLHLANGGFVKISTDRDVHPVVEAFVYHDEEGYVVD